MCMLTFVKPGATPDIAALRNGAWSNPHGHGYALITADTITTGHSLDPETALAEFAALRFEYPHGPALFHSRFATHGKPTLDNCHPFPVGGDERTVLAHNGILPPNVHPGPGDERSDTRIAAEDFLPTAPFGSLDSWRGREGLERWLGSDKFVLLTLDPAYAQRAYIFNEARGHWDNDTGIWYSNHDHLPSRWHYEDYSDYGYCHGCGEEDSTLAGPHCCHCGFCAACYAPFPHCECPDLAGHQRYAALLDMENA
ncbi:MULTISPECIES: class II glutamine amidotransferase domain-containing protein [Nocardia]|uniref:hypothetical protein n=1 Tax=Nocardia TaxID=1817 RepID=UPI000D68CB2F|nr:MULTISPECIES: hypothetical protein [Nocardia]